MQNSVNRSGTSEDVISEIPKIRRVRGRVICSIATLFIIFALTTAVLGAESEPSGKAELTEAERVWIAGHPIVRLTPDPLFPPLEYFDEDGKFRGIGADFVAVLEKKLGLRFEVVRVKNWNESVTKTKNRENDIWSVVAKTPERSEYMLFTKPYIESPAIIVARSDVETQLSVKDLKGLKVAVSSGYAVHEDLMRRFPDMPFDLVPDPMTGLKKVSLGLADAMVINIALASHLMEKAGISNLRMVGEVGYTYRWGFASRKDWPVLHTILEKGLAQITQEERQAIIRKRVSLKDQPFVITKTIVFSALGFLAIFGLAGVLVWNQSLKRQIKLRTKDVETELAERIAAESALRDSENMLATAIESISDGFLMTDREDRIILSNNKFRNLYPSSHDLIFKGAKIEDFLRGGAERGEYPEALGRLDEWLAYHMSEIAKDTSVVEERLIGDRWLRAAARRLPDGGRVSIHVDITEIKQAQTEIQDKADLIQLMRRTASNANMAESLNEAMRNVLDDVCAYSEWPVGHVYVRSEDDAKVLVSTDIWHLDEPERFATFREITEKTTLEQGAGLPGRVAASGRPAWIFDVTKDPNFPRAKLAEDIGVKAGFACPVLMGTEAIAVLEFFAANAVEPDQSLLDTLFQIGLQLGRVAERVTARDSLLDSRQRLAAVFENIYDGIITIDERGLIQRFNPAAEKIFGYAADEVIGQNTSVLMPEPYQSKHDGYLKNYYETGEAKIIGKGREVEGKRKNGSTFPLDLAVSEMWIGDQRLFTGIVRDISERKQLDSMKNEFISTVSHELRTPLTSIKGSLGLVRSGVTGELPEKLRSMVDIAYNNSDRLVRLINDILDIEKIEAGKMHYHMEVLDLMPLVEQAIEENKGFGDQHGVTLAINDTVPDAKIEGDRDRLMQVLTNFLSNAAKFSPEGERVEMSASRQDGGYRVAVTDHGPGIPENFRDKIFGKFTQADSSDTRGKGGTGLGLSISKAIVEEHGGTIGFDTETDKGTTFFFDLPKWEETKVTPSITEAAQSSAGRILVCEDEPDIAKLLELMLNSPFTKSPSNDSMA